MKLIKPILGAVAIGAMSLPLTSCVSKSKSETKTKSVLQTPLAYPALLKPGKAFVLAESGKFSLSNNVLNASWNFSKENYTSATFVNNATTDAFEQPEELFSILLKDGKIISSKDMTISSAPQIKAISQKVGSLKASDRFTGQAIEVEFTTSDENLTVLWRAELKNCANYVREVVTFTAKDKAIDLEKITLIDKKSTKVSTVGSVQGSVVTDRNFFLAYEHPMANNGNGSSLLPVGQWKTEQLTTKPQTLSFDVTKLITQPGTYHPQFVGSGSRVNITKVKLIAKGPLELIHDDKEVAVDAHAAYTSKDKNYWNIFSLEVKEIDTTKSYTLEVTVAATEKGKPCSGSVAINRKFSTPQIECSYTRNAPLEVDQPYVASSVIGVYPKSQLRRAFLYYLERERVHPYRTFLNYNSWYDIGYFNKYTEADALAVIKGFGEELVQKRGVKMDSLLFDDGWDNDETLWKFHKDFPNGFTNVTKEANSYGIDPGVWLSPWGGYGKPRENRIKAGREQGFEIYEDKENPYNSVFKMSGPKYYERFSSKCKEMITKYNVNQFKFDGIGGNSGSGADGFTPDFEAALKLISELQDLRPDVYINLTTGTWPSPFWLQTCDSIWRGGFDHQFKGPGSKRQQWITYRDGEVYNRIVKNGPLFPISSLMVHGTILAKKVGKELNHTTEGEFRDEIRSMFGGGSQLQELYITPSLMNKQNWDDLAVAAKWARKNADTLLDVHWVGGNPYKNQIYGFAAWSPDHSALTFRNPSDKEETFSFTIRELLELPEGYNGVMKLKCPFPITIIKGKAQLPQRLMQATRSVDKKIKLKMKPFEVLVFDLTPVVAEVKQLDKPVAKKAKITEAK
ncbi:MAG: hypothetical protein KAG98_01355 [Lentisphaeria bacterium]|nr:hypothetical protein [Lentisphaeria bacterium]